MTESVPTSRGLERVEVGRSAISLVDGSVGNLVYRGFDIAEIVPGTPYESLVHLLLLGETPPEDPSRVVREALATRRTIPTALARVVDALPRGLPPLEAMRTLVSILGDGSFGYPPTVEQGYELIGRLPVLFCRFLRRSKGLDPAEPSVGDSHVANYLALLSGTEPDPRRVRALEAYFDLLADHGMNASTFALCIAISTESDLMSGATAALSVLKGPRHGGAPSLVIDMLDAVGTPENAARWIDDRLARHELLFGFGHRVYKVEDPRSALLHRMAKEVGDPQRVDLAEAVEREALLALRRQKPGSRIYTNVEFYAALLLEAVGIPPDCFTATFALARTAGWAAHALEQAEGNRVIRPDVRYDGPPAGRRWPRPRPER